MLFFQFNCLKTCVDRGFKVVTLKEVFLTERAIWYQLLQAQIPSVEIFKCNRNAFVWKFVEFLLLLLEKPTRSPPPPHHVLGTLYSRYCKIGTNVTVISKIVYIK